jgi:hypothetical protein
VLFRSVGAYDDAADATDAAVAAIVAAGWTITAFGDDADAASGPVENNVFVYDLEAGDEETVLNFGTEGADVISFAPGMYTLVEIDALDGTAVGSVSALEIFVLTDDDGTTLFVETNTFDGNSAAAQEGLVEIVLTGVDSVTLNAQGYLTGTQAAA